TLRSGPILLDSWAISLHSFSRTELFLPHVPDVMTPSGRSSQTGRGAPGEHPRQAYSGRRGWTVRVSEPCVHPRCRVCSFLALCASRRIRRSVLHIARTAALMCRSPRLGFRHRPVEGPPLAASSTDRTTDIALRTASPRVTFAKLGDPIEVPDQLSLQTTSFDWLLGNERWQESAAEASAAGREDVPQASGLADILEEISPIEDFAGNMSLSF